MNIQYIMDIESSRKMPPIFPLDFSIIRSYKQIYAMYFVRFKTPHEEVFCENTQL